MTHSERIRVAVVDDQVDIADNFVELLKLEGIDARPCYDGQQAIDLIASFKPDCVLFDIAMPGLDGLELARQLRTTHGDDIVLLAMTGNADDARAADAFAVVDHYFSKPFEFAELMKILRPSR